MAIKLLDAATATGAGGAVSRSGAKSAIEAHGTTSSGAGAATVVIQGRNDDTGACRGARWSARDLGVSAKVTGCHVKR